MLIMALDSSGVTATAAIAAPDKIIAEYSVNNKLTHSQTLLPMLEEIRRMAGLDMKDLDAVALTGGPGSFTGLRIGSSTAKGIALALGIPVISVPTLEAMAWNLIGREGLVCPMMDARRGQVYTGIYRSCGTHMETVADQMAADAAEIAGKLNDLGEKVTILGDGADAYLDRLKETLTVPWEMAPVHLSRPRAGAVAMCAFWYWQQGKAVNGSQHVPTYLRLSQAERVRAEKENADN